MKQMKPITCKWRIAEMEVWEQEDENDPICGRGWVIIEIGEMKGCIYLHLVNNSAFRAIKSK